MNSTLSVIKDNLDDATKASTAIIAAANEMAEVARKTKDKKLAELYIGWSLRLSRSATMIALSCLSTAAKILSLTNGRLTVASKKENP